jgi:hypothetical protein
MSRTAGADRGIWLKDVKIGLHTFRKKSGWGIRHVPFIAAELNTTFQFL